MLARSGRHRVSILQGLLACMLTRSLVRGPAPARAFLSPPAPLLPPSHRWRGLPVGVEPCVWQGLGLPGSRGVAVKAATSVPASPAAGKASTSKRKAPAAKAKAGGLAKGGAGAGEQKLIIVESPTKAKTIRKFLPAQGWDVDFCMGHVRELPRSASDLPKTSKEKFQVTTTILLL
jgi:hypothetical protein